MANGEDSEEEVEYDPFTEEPAPHVAQDVEETEQVQPVVVCENQVQSSHTSAQCTNEGEVLTCSAETGTTAQSAVVDGNALLGRSIQLASPDETVQIRSNFMQPTPKDGGPSMQALGGFSKAGGGMPPIAMQVLGNESPCDLNFSTEIPTLVAAAQAESEQSLANIQSLTAQFAAVGATEVPGKAPGFLGGKHVIRPVPPWKRPPWKKPPWKLPPWKQHPPPVPAKAMADSIKGLPAPMPVPGVRPKLMPTQPKVPMASKAAPAATPVPKSPTGKKRKAHASKGKVLSAAAVAANWLQRGGRKIKAAVTRMSNAAALAEEYFTHAPPPAKRQCLEPLENFSPQLLAKAPTSIQTCRSLLLFLNRKLEAAVPPVPMVGGPQDLRTRLETHADNSGRLDALRSNTGWDARAKRVLDIAGAARSAIGEGLLSGAEKRLETIAAKLELELKERGEDNVEALTKERCAWVQEQTRRDWMAWCARLLHQREKSLLAEVDSNEAAATPKKLADAVDVANILEALLTGGGSSPSPQVTD